ncbi:MAG: amidase family protein [Anaerolineae bacterium]|jgi:amidase|nr:amidase family protein [Anaerolineae bacterium]
MKRLLVLCVLLCLTLTMAVYAQEDNSPRLRELDFTPFEEALAHFSDEQATEIDNLLQNTTILDIQKAMNTGVLTSEELTLYFLARIRRYDDILRHYLELNPMALEEARKADELRANGTILGALHGIPVNLKDNIETATPMHTTAGAEILLNYVAMADAPLVVQLRAGGAVILGKANLSEFAGIITEIPGYSAVGGQVQNPHSPDLSPLGSSAGSAASVAAYLTMVSVGTETSGSIIAPSSINGVVGMYPGEGVMDGAGIIPLILNNDTAGPIGRTVTDVALLLDVIDTLQVDYVAGLDVQALQGVHVGLLDFGNDDVAGLLNTYFTDVGATVQAVELSGDVDTFGQLSNASFFSGIDIDLGGHLSQMDLPIATLAELVTYNAESPTIRIPRGQAILEMAVNTNATTPISDGDYAQIIAYARQSASDILDATLADNDIEILVTLGNTHSLYYSTANYPAITIPLGLLADGMISGVTLIGKPGSEARLLALAYAFEQATQLRVTPVLPEN